MSFGPDFLKSIFDKANAGFGAAAISPPPLTLPPSPVAAAAANALKRKADQELEKPNSDKRLQISQGHAGTSNAAAALLQNPQQEEQEKIRAETKAIPYYYKYAQTTEDENGQKHLLIANQSIPLKFISSGTHWVVYELNLKSQLVIGKCAIPPGRYALKSILGVLGPDQMKREIQDSVKAYKELSNNPLIALPKCFINPETFIDPNNPKNGGFWLVQIIEHPVNMENLLAAVAPFSIENILAAITRGKIDAYLESLKDLPLQQKKTVAMFIKLMVAFKRFFEEVVNNHNPSIFDVHPNNFGFDSELNLFLLDFALAPAPDEDDDYIFNLQKDFKKTCLGNKAIYEFLISNFKTWNGLWNFDVLFPEKMEN